MDGSDQELRDHLTAAVSIIRYDREGCGKKMSQNVGTNVGGGGGGGDDENDVEDNDDRVSSSTSNVFTNRTTELEEDEEEEEEEGGGGDVDREADAILRKRLEDSMRACDVIQGNIRRAKKQMFELQDRVLFEGRSVVIRGVQDEVFEGQRGIVRGRDQTKEGNFKVEISNGNENTPRKMSIPVTKLCSDAKILCIRCTDVEGTKGAETREGTKKEDTKHLVEATNTTVGQSEEGSKTSLLTLRPGSLYVGTICIPGIESTYGSVPYGVSVVDTLNFVGSNPSSTEADDSLDLVLRHGAHGDVQSCHISKFDRKKGLIEFSDQETTCRVISVEKNAKGRIVGMKGNVSQLLNPYDDSRFYHEEIQATHKLDVSITCCTELDEYCVAKTSLLQLKRQRVGVVHNMSRILFEFVASRDRLSVRESPSLVEFARNVRTRLNLLEVVHESQLLFENVCAAVRRRADRLRGQAFGSAAEKKDFLSQMEALEWNRKGVHKRLDVAFQVTCSVGQLYNFTALNDSEKMERMHVATEIFYKGRSRSEVTYRTFDLAVKSIENRVPLDVIRAMQKKSEANDGDGGWTNATCAICMDTFESCCSTRSSADDHDACSAKSSCRRLRLPCGHRFHVACIKEWLNDHASCPCCRRKVSWNAGS